MQIQQERGRGVIVGEIEVVAEFHVHAPVADSPR
jgi:hypothetical protein